MVIIRTGFISWKLESNAYQTSLITGKCGIKNILIKADLGNDAFLNKKQHPYDLII
jgi:hypothetical protein